MEKTMFVEYVMNICGFPQDGYATRPLARPDKRLPLSLLLAGMSLPRRRFVPGTRLTAPASQPNYGF